MTIGKKMIPENLDSEIFNKQEAFRFYCERFLEILPNSPIYEELIERISKLSFELSELYNLRMMRSILKSEK